MNSIERLQHLSGITIVEGASYSPSKKYAGCDKAELEKAKKELTAITVDTATPSFKHQNAVEELKAVNAALASLADADKSKDVKEGEEEITPIVEAKDEDDKEKKDEKDDDEKDSDKKDDDKDSDDDKPAFFKKKDDDKDDDEKDDDKDDDDKPAFLKGKDKDDDKSDDKKDDKKDDDCKCDESVAEIVAKILAPEVEAPAVVEGTVIEEPEEEVAAVEESTELSPEELAAKILEADLTPQEIKVDYQNGPEENSGIKKEEGDKIRVPADVKKETKQRIAELKSAIERYDDKGYNDKSIKQQALDCLEQILDNLSAGNVEGVKQAQIYFGTLMSPLTDFFPPKLINFLAHALNPNATHPNTK